ncbi:MAG: CAP domain-containing protein [Acidobacteriota bacterium]|nr:CAP domain-containing protein [Acidobacteriota bacterium]
MIRGLWLLLLSPVLTAQVSTEQQLPTESVLALDGFMERAVRGAEATIAEQVVAIVNAERAAEGLPPLKLNPLLNNSSDLHAENMAVRNFFAHCDLDTLTQAWDRMVDAGYFWNAAAENIAAGQSSPEVVMISWMNSSGHRANILSTDYREIGVGYFYQGGDTGGIRQDLDSNCAADNPFASPLRHYWVQNFGRNSNVYPMIINDEAAETEDPMVTLFIYGSGTFTEMRLRNAGETWGAWEPFQEDTVWELPAGSGLKTVEVEMRYGGTTRNASDSIQLNLICFTFQDIQNDAETWPGVDVIDLIQKVDAFCE